jgi:hypothetical protein
LCLITHIPPFVEFALLCVSLGLLARALPSLETLRPCSYLVGLALDDCLFPTRTSHHRRLTLASLPSAFVIDDDDDDDDQATTSSHQVNNNLVNNRHLFSLVTRPQQRQPLRHYQPDRDPTTDLTTRVSRSGCAICLSSSTRRAGVSTTSTPWTGARHTGGPGTGFRQGRY